MKKLLFLFLCSFCTTSFAQKHTNLNHKKAQKAYDKASEFISSKLYDKAIEQLEQAVNLDTQYIAAYQQLGDLYRKFSNDSAAKINYQKVINLNPEFLPLTYFGIARSELNTGDYTNALHHFKKYQSYNTLSEVSKKTVLKYIEDCEFSLEAIKNPVEFKPVNLGEGINTKEQEYLPAITADEETIIFTRKANNAEDFYTSKKEDSKWATATYLSKNINTEMYNEGSQCISQDGMYLFFTGCNRPDGLGKCDIYVSKREGKDWSKPFNIGAPINTMGWESQPSLSADGRTLYFVSTRPGGFGGYDIWKSELIKEGSWTVPENMGPTINTPYDEQSPFIHPDNQTLYFSSNGWPGLGNKDLFMSRREIPKNSSDKAEWQKPVNLGYPINTYGEESSLTISSDGQHGFFASNQKGGFGGLDIYSFELPEKIRPNLVTYVKGLVIDKSTKDTLDAKIQMTNLATGEVIFDEVTDDETGEFLTTMAIGKSFGLNVSKPGYMFYSQNFTLDTIVNKPFHILVPLQKIEVDSMVVLNNIFFETNKYDLLPESEVELKQLIRFLTENPRVTIEISGYTDNVGNDKSNQLLSENRARTVYNNLILNKISPSRLSYQGYGKNKPLTENATEEGRKNNRRTEFKITKN